MSKGLSIRGYTLHELRHDPTCCALQNSMSLIVSRMAVSKPKIAKTFPLAQVVQAYQYLESNAQVGKVVITI
jgi:NADPH:quinone reductase-like Zn-dependent oxidoreductase